MPKKKRVFELNPGFDAIKVCFGAWTENLYSFFTDFLPLWDRFAKSSFGSGFWNHNLGFLRWQFSFSHLLPGYVFTRYKYLLFKTNHPARKLFDRKEVLQWPTHKTHAAKKSHVVLASENKIQRKSNEQHARHSVEQTAEDCLPPDSSGFIPCASIVLHQQDQSPTII